MSKVPQNQGKERTKEDLTQLNKLAKGNTPTPLIGYKLGRSTPSIYAKASEQKLSLHPTNKSPYGTKKK